MQVEKVVAFRMPDGSCIQIQTTNGISDDEEKVYRSWETMDVTLVNPDGSEDLLCSVDYDTKLGLRTFVFDADEEVAYERKVR